MYTDWQLIVVWFGTSSASTKLHSDCCDNYAMMIAGTKRWNVAPPSEARILRPKCTGGLCWVPALEHADEHAVGKAIQRRDATQLAEFYLKPGELLFLPTGWFHHVENIGPTIMVNFWTHGKAGFLRNMNGEFNDLQELLDAEESE
jgi:ribosomal protein L16 Arg81 hydroxylase